MKHALTKLFKHTFGVIVRLVQRSLDPNSPNIISELTKLAAQSSALYVTTTLLPAPYFWSRVQLWEHVINSNPRSGLIFAEFGVNKGESLKKFVTLLSADSKIYGFDSFYGLSENWWKGSALKNMISTSGKIPIFSEKNVKLFPGWYEETLPIFMHEIKNLQIDILHLDSDTFTPTNLILTKLKKISGQAPY